MNCITTIHPNWIPPIATGCPLLTFSPPLPSPPPTYDGQKDTIVFYVIPKFGARAWELSPYPLPAAEVGRTTAKSAEQWKWDQDEVYRWFARLLLEGKVCRPFLKLSQEGAEWCLNDPPAMITHRKPVRKVLEMIQPLREMGVSSRAGLEEMWSKDKKFLRSSVEKWVKPQYLPLLKQVWGELTSSAQQKL